MSAPDMSPARAAARLGAPHSQRGTTPGSASKRRRRPQVESAGSPLLSKLQSTHHKQQLSATQSAITDGTNGGNHQLSTANTSKLKMLEHYMDAFPVDRPSRDQGLRLDGEADHNRQHRGTVAEREIRRLEKEQASRRVRSDNAREAFGHAKKQKIETWVQLAERNNRKLKKENETLARIAQLTQENCINNDARYDETINALRAELEYTTLYRQDSAPTLSYVWDAVGNIQDRIVQMKTTGERQASADFTKMKTELEQLLEQRTKDLEDVRQSGSNTTGEWVARNQELQEQLEKLLYKTDAAYGTNQQLLAGHKQLQVEHDAQMEDSQVLERQFHQVSVHHQRLKDRIHDLELELASLAHGNVESEEEAALRSIDDLSRGLHKGATAETDQASASYASSLRKAQALLATETDNLRAVRAGHVQALKQRSELEVFLRQAILHHVQHNKERLTLEGLSETSAMTIASKFTAQDRRQVIERILMKPRVLQLLYNEDAAAMMRSDEAAQIEKVTSEDVEELWAKWKQWTSEADAQLADEDLKA